MAGVPGALCLVLTLLSGPQQAVAAHNDTAAVERGRYLVAAGGCITCHTADRPNAIALAGGRALVTPFGTFYSPNLTPDVVTGIGAWTDADFGRALRAGIAPDGSYYYPVFPYPSYTGLNDEDVAAIAAYLRSLKPVHQPRLAHALPWYLAYRPALFGWNLLNFSQARFQPDAAHSTEWNRGAYLVRHLGHCGECHSPRNLLGAVDHDRELTGNPSGPDGKKIPDISQHPKSGIGRWDLDDIVTLLEVGLLPGGDFAGSSMSDVIDDNTSKLTPEDRRAIAVYLMSLPASGAGLP